jgi:hypothetical protein
MVIDWSIQMTEPLVKQIVDLKDEHSLMLEMLKKARNAINTLDIGVLGWGEFDGDDFQEYHYSLRDELLDGMNKVIKVAEEGNERRLERGNVDLPDRRGMKDGTT